MERFYDFGDVRGIKCDSEGKGFCFVPFDKVLGLPGEYVADIALMGLHFAIPRKFGIKIVEEWAGPCGTESFIKTPPFVRCGTFAVPFSHQAGVIAGIS